MSMVLKTGTVIAGILTTDWAVARAEVAATAATSIWKGCMDAIFFVRGGEVDTKALQALYDNGVARVTASVVRRLESDSAGSEDPMRAAEYRQPSDLGRSCH